MEEKYRYTQIKKQNGEVFEAKLEVIKSKVKKYNNVEVEDMVHQYIGNYQEISETLNTYKNRNNGCNKCGNCQCEDELDVIEDDTFFDGKENVEIDD